MDYFNRPGSAGGDARTPRTPSAFPRLSQTTSAYDNPSRLRPQAPVRIRRLPSGNSLTRVTSATQPSKEDEEVTGRKRSFSAPQRPSSTSPSRPSSSTSQRPLKRTPTTAGLASVAEESSHTGTPMVDDNLRVPNEESEERRASNAASTAAEWVLGRPRRSSSTSRPARLDPNYERDVVDMLDVIDPEVSTLTTLNNMQNTLAFPFDFGRYFNRQATYDLSRRPTALSRRPTALSTVDSLSRVATVDEAEEMELQKKPSQVPSIFGAPLAHSHSISSNLTDTNYAVLPHGIVLEGWSDEDKAELNDYVRHLMHSRKAKFRRSMRAFGKYVKTPLGFFVTTYAFLVTFWGTAWVFFIIGWLSAGSRQAYFINICDQILVALFALNGDVLAPFRVVDTYHMYFIQKYHRKTLRLRKERGLPPLEDPFDLPEVNGDEETVVAKPEEVVLTEAEQKKFDHHRAKFCKAHTYYKPHATFTHRAFSLDYLMAIVILLDFHSIFQITLGATTWGISYHVRPAALTAVILALSLSCNITGGILISVGDKKTRKKEIMEQLFRQALTEEAIHKMEKKKDLKVKSGQEALAEVIVAKNDKEDTETETETKAEPFPSIEEEEEEEIKEKPKAAARKEKASPVVEKQQQIPSVRVEESDGSGK